jgi:hypothetical protein
MQQKASSLVFLQYLTTVFDNLEDSILLIGVEPDGHYRMLLANGSFTRSTGFIQENVGQLVEDILKPESYAHLSKQYRKVVETKKPTEYTDWFDVLAGRAAYKVKLIPILSSVGECIQIAAICTNVTELLNLRAELKAKTEALVKIGSSSA